MNSSSSSHTSELAAALSKCPPDHICMLDAFLIPIIGVLIMGAFGLMILGCAMNHSGNDKIKCERERVQCKEFLERHGITALWRAMWATRLGQRSFKTEGWTKEHLRAFQKFKISYYTAHEDLEAVLKIQQQEEADRVAANAATTTV